MKSISLALPLIAILAACAPETRKQPIKRDQRGAAESRSDLSQRVLGDSASKRCLRVGALKRLAQENKTFFIYTSDIDVGTLRPTGVKGQPDCRTFASGLDEIDKSSRALLTLTDVLPERETVTGANLLASKLARGWLDATEAAPPAGGAAKTEACPAAVFPGNEDFIPICASGATSVQLRSLRTGEIRAYSLGRDRLTISSFTPIDHVPTCSGDKPAPGLVLKRTFTIGWDQALERVQLRLPFAAVLAAHLNSVPTELALGKPVTKNGKNAQPDTVAVVNAVFSYMVDQVGQGKFKSPCVN